MSIALSRRARVVAGVVAALPLLTAGGTPATADPIENHLRCGAGAVLPCLTEVVPLPDVFGDLKGVPCGGLFTSETRPEGDRLYWNGTVFGATYLNTDPQTQRMRITCTIRDSDTEGTGTVRGSVSNSNIPPLNNMVTASTLSLSYWERYPGPDRVWLCTTVTWVDRAGLGHSYSYDDNPDKAGAQCLEVLPITAGI